MLGVNTKANDNDGLALYKQGNLLGVTIANGYNQHLGAPLPSLGCRFGAGFPQNHYSPEADLFVGMGGRAESSATNGPPSEVLAPH